MPMRLNYHLILEFHQYSMLHIYILIENLKQRNEDDQEEVQWMKQLPTTKQLQMEKILDQKIVKKTRKQDYYEYLVKWKDLPTEDATWMTVAEIQKHGKQFEDLMDKSP
jgi:hypothetical protein